MSDFVHFVHAKMELRIYSSIILDPNLEVLFKYFTFLVDKWTKPTYHSLSKNTRTTKTTFPTTPAMNALFEQAYQKLLETQDPELESLCDAMAQYIPTTPHQPEPAFQPNGEIDLDDSLYPAEMDWGFDKPDVPHTTVYIFNKEEEDTSEFASIGAMLQQGATCYKCDEPVPLLYLNGENDPNDETWVCCAYTGWYCPSHSQTSNCGDMECVGCNPAWSHGEMCECPVCENSEEDEEEEEADKPATTETPSDKGKQ